MKRLFTPVFNHNTSEKSEFVKLPGLVLKYSDENKMYATSLVLTSIGLRKSELKGLILVLLLIIMASAHVFGQEPAKNSYSAKYTTNPPTIDGLINDVAWEEGTWCSDFTQNEPQNSHPVSQKTSFKILFDDNNLYVAIKAYDTNTDSVVSRLTRRDQPDGDLLAICLDSYHDLRTGFLFGVSASGVKYDEVFTNDGQNQDYSWDPNWWVKTSVNTGCWIAEMKIPFSQLRFEKNSGSDWGMEIARVIYRKNETDFWQHIPKDAPGLVHMFGILKGLEKIKPRKTFDLSPYTLAKVQMLNSANGNNIDGSGKRTGFNLGLDSKIGVSNNLTMDLTFNPDFGQVEADPSVVNLTAFETFFKEQRPFFVEGNNITDFNLGVGDDRVGNDNLFYSRRIGRVPQTTPSSLRDGWTADVPKFTSILGAVKLTGKTSNGLAVGFIDALTNREMAVIDTAGGKFSQAVEPLTNYFVGRVQKEIHSGNTIIGGIITSTTRSMDSTLAASLHKHAYTGGIDFTQYLRNKSWMINLNSAFSFVDGTSEAITRTQESSARYFQRPDNDYAKFNPLLKSLSGSGGKLRIMKLNGHLNVMGAFIWKTPGFETNDIGYLQQADQIIGAVSTTYNQWIPKGIYKHYSVGWDVYNMFDFRGESTIRGLENNSNITFKNYWSGYFSGSITGNQLSNSMLRGGPSMKLPGTCQLQGGISTDNRKKYTVSAGAGLTYQYLKCSNTHFFNATLQYRPSNFMMFSISPQLNIHDDQLQYITTLSFNDNQRYIFAAIRQKTVSASFRANINVTPDLSIQYWGQPFISAGSYTNYKYITSPRAGKLSDRYKSYSDDQISKTAGGYSVDENRDGTEDYQINSTDFNYKAFLSNLIIRWEYNPGSSIYLVWSQSRNGMDSTGAMYWKDFGSIFTARPANIFLVKFSYRFGIK